MSLPLLYGQASALLNEQTNIDKNTQRIIRSYKYLLEAFQMLLDRKGKPAFFGEFRNKIKQLADSLNPNDSEIPILNLIVTTNEPITAHLLQLLNQLAIKRLSNCIADIHATNPIPFIEHVEEEPIEEEIKSSSSPLKRKLVDTPFIEQIDLIEEEESLKRKLVKPDTPKKQVRFSENVKIVPPVPKTKKLKKPVLKYNDDEEELKVKGISLTFSPIVWEDPIINKWKWAAFIDDTNGIYDQINDEVYDSQEDASSASEIFSNQVNINSSLLHRALVGWEQYNDDPCKDVQGTEQLSIIHNNEPKKYLIVFRTTQLNNTDNIEIQIKNWITDVLKKLKADKSVHIRPLNIYKFIQCEPFHGLVYSVLELVNVVSDIEINTIDNEIFDNL